MSDNKQYTDVLLIQLLKDGDEKALEILYQQYYNSLCISVNRIVDHPVATEDIVQDLFLNLWLKRKSLTIQSSLRAYLKRAAPEPRFKLLEGLSEIVNLLPGGD